MLTTHSSKRSPRTRSSYASGRFAFLLVWLLLGISSPSTQAQELVHETITKDGLRIWAFPDDGGDRFVMMVLVGSGSRHETPGKTGLAHLLEHVLLGSTKEWNKAQSRDRLDELGAVDNGYTTQSVTTYYLSCPSDSWREAIDWLAKHLVDPALNPADVRDECKIVYEELDSNQPDTETLTFESLLYPGHPLGRLIGGDRDGINSLDEDDLREFYASHYRAPNMAIGFAGKVSRSECVAEISRAFAALSAVGEVSAIDPVRPWTGSEIVPNSGYGSGWLNAGYHLPSGSSKDKATQLVLRDYLAKRAFDLIREEHQLAYAPSFDLHHYADTTRLTFSIQVSKQSNLPEVTSLLSELIRELGQAQPAALNSALRSARTTMEVNDTEDLSIAMELAWYMRRNDESPASLQRAIEAIGSKELADYSKKHLTEANRFEIANAGLENVSLFALALGAVFLLVLIDAVRGFRWAHAAQEHWSDRRRRRAGSQRKAAAKIVPIRGEELERSFQDFFESEDQTRRDDG